MLFPEAGAPALFWCPGRGPTLQGEAFPYRWPERCESADPDGNGMTTDWICFGTTAWASTPALGRFAARVGSTVGQLARGRLERERWIRYRIGLDGGPSAPDGVRLSPVTDDFVRCLRTHPDHEQNQLVSGLRFWEHGLRRAYVWCDEAGGGPLCMQWLLMRPDNVLLRTLPEWAGMYPPLARGWGQVENLFAFSTARRKGVATQFELALFQVARDLGLSGLVTHIAERNEPARGWADRLGWEAYGVIVRYRLDLPGFRSRPLYLHRLGQPL